MPINNNIACLNAYDRASVIPVEYQGACSQPHLQHALHCVAFEALRGWSAFTLNEYNTMGEPEPYQSTRATIIAEAATRATLNPACAAEVPQLTPGDIEIAGNLGENYFEHGYVQITSNIHAPAKRNFERDSGISAN